MTAQALHIPLSQRLAAVALAAATTLVSFSAMQGLADGYHAQQLLAQATAASQPVAAAAPARKALSLRG